MEIHDPAEIGLVYGSGNGIMAWHVDMKKPKALAIRNDSNNHRSHITSLAFKDGKLYDAGYGGLVRETISGDILGNNYSGKPHKLPVFGLDFLGDDLVALKHVPRGRNQTASLVYVNNDKNINDILPINWQDQLDYRRTHSLGLKITRDNKIYMNSERIIQINPNDSLTKKPSVNELTDYLSDFVYLASDGDKVYSLHSHNPDTTPEGTEVRDLTSNKRVAFWVPAYDWEGREDQKYYGYTIMSASIGNTLIIGTKKFINTDGNKNTSDDLEFSIYCVNLTPKMFRAEGGARATPHLLIKDAYQEPQVYGSGNPMIVMTRYDLEKILK